MEESRVPDMFIKACRAGNLDSLKTFIQETPALLEQPDPKSGLSPLSRSIMCGNTSASKLLITLGANCNFKDPQGHTILHQAINNSQTREAKLLLKHQADPNELQPGNLYTDGNTCLHLACAKQNSDLVSLLLSYSADPNIKNPFNGKTPLHLAAESSSVAIIELLLKSKANPALKDNFGRSCTDLSKPDIRSLFLRFNKGKDEEKSSRSSPLLLPSPQNVECIPEIPLESFTSLDLSPVSAKTKLIFEGFDKQGSTYLESEKNEGRYSKAFSFGSPTGLLKWLESVKLEFLYEALMLGGFDDIEQMVQQMKSNFAITEEMLEGIGIDKPGHRKRLLAALDEETRSTRKKHHRSTQSNPLKCCFLAEPFPSSLVSAPDLNQWLETLNYQEYLELFTKAGYDDLEHLFSLMNSKFPINDHILYYEIGIKSQNHRHRIIKKLKTESLGFESMKKIKNKNELLAENTACEFCVII